MTNNKELLLVGEQTGHVLRGNSLLKTKHEGSLRDKEHKENPEQ